MERSRWFVRGLLNGDENYSENHVYFTADGTWTKDLSRALVFRSQGDVAKYIRRRFLAEVIKQDVIVPCRRLVEVL